MAVLKNWTGLQKGYGLAVVFGVPMWIWGIFLRPRYTSTATDVMNQSTTNDKFPMPRNYEWNNHFLKDYSNQKMAIPMIHGDPSLIHPRDDEIRDLMRREREVMEETG